MVQTMMAVRLFEHGGPEVLQYIETPIPEVGPDDVLLRVHATAVNSWDLRYRSGNLPRPLPGRPSWPLPFQLGRDAAGEIVATGENVTRWRPGDRAVQLPHPRAATAPCAYADSKTCASTPPTQDTRSSADTPSTSPAARTPSCPSPTASTTRQPRPPCGPTPPPQLRAPSTRRPRRHRGHHRRQRRNGHRLRTTGKTERSHRHRHHHQGGPRRSAHQTRLRPHRALHRSPTPRTGTRADPRPGRRRRLGLRRRQRLLPALPRLHDSAAPSSSWAHRPARDPASNWTHSPSSASR